MACASTAAAAAGIELNATAAGLYRNIFRRQIKRQSNTQFLFIKADVWIPGNSHVLFDDDMLPYCVALYCQGKEMKINREKFISRKTCLLLNLITRITHQVLHGDQNV